MKKTVSVILTLILVLCFAACTNTSTPVADPTAEPAADPTAEVTGDTIGKTYLNAFEKSTAGTAEEVANELAALEEMVVMEVQPGFLDGMTEDIDGFTKGYKFSPMIGAIPFVAYVFETEDTDALQATLKEKADLAWNICTEADEMVSGSRDNLVFFIMCSNEEV